MRTNGEKIEAVGERRIDAVMRMISREKAEEVLTDIAGRLDVPLLVTDCDGRPLLTTGDKARAFTGDNHSASNILARGAPLRLNGEVIGSLVPGPGGESKREALTAAAYCIENFLVHEMEVLDLSAEVVRVYEEQALIYSLTSKLGTEMDVESICRGVLEEADKILGVQNMAIMLYDEVSNELYTRLCRGRDCDVAVHFRADAANGSVAHILAKGEPVTICDVASVDGPSFPYPVRSVLYVPLVTDRRSIGMLLASDKLSGEEFWSHDLKLMGVLASEVAASIRKAQLYEEISELFMHTVEALASAIDAKDPYTYGHSRRVAQLSTAICEEMGMNRKETRNVELAAILHDIGKIGTPESILRKPGRLDPDEMETVRAHPEQGAHILSNISEFRDVIRWIRHHHEWYDGKGYPDRIAAEHIPLEARVIAVADTFDAMTSDRPYRKGMPSVEAIRIMEECAGSQFDPAVLDTFKKIFSEGKIV
ncbi:MAG TPA: HD domain-containing phosphohydrolase [Geobacteraceae bacterium]